MKIHEYQAKEIFSKYGIPVERHTLCRTAAGVIAAYRRMGTDRVVIKAQVLTGGRGKAGGVKLVNNTEDAYQEAKNILGMSIKGLPVNQVLVSEAVDIAAEYYVSYTIDRNTRSVVLMMSASGGMDIEEVDPSNTGENHPIFNQSIYWSSRLSGKAFCFLSFSPNGAGG